MAVTLTVQQFVRARPPRDALRLLPANGVGMRARARAYAAAEPLPRPGRRADAPCAPRPQEEILNRIAPPAPVFPPSGLGHPGPLGLGGFALTTFTLSVYNTGVIIDPAMVGCARGAHGAHVACTSAIICSTRAARARGPRRALPSL